MTFDTCFLIDLQREQRRRLVGAARAFSAKTQNAPTLISVVAFGEFALGYENPDDSRLLSIVSLFELVPVDRQIAAVYSRIGKLLHIAGTPIGANDLWIAATALQQNLPLVTRDLEHFRRIPDLQLIGY